jgi:hypothetical protein
MLLAAVVDDVVVVGAVFVVVFAVVVVFVVVTAVFVAVLLSLSVKNSCRYVTSVLISAFQSYP